MKKKIFILFILIFLLCGCTAEVNVDVEDMKIKESVSIDAYPDSNYSKEQLLKAFRKYVPIEYDVPIIDTMPDEEEKGITYYNRSYKDIGNGYRFTYNYNFNINNYSKARTIKGAFKSSTVQVNKGDKEILISTDSSNIMYFNEYPSLTKVTINIKPSYKVKESNADSVSNNVYTWSFDKNTKKNIYLLLSTEEKSTAESDKDKNPTDSKPSKSNDKKYNSEFEEFVNEHPLIVAIGAILLFIVVVSIISKITKYKY